MNIPRIPWINPIDRSVIEREAREETADLPAGTVTRAALAPEVAAAVDTIPDITPVTAGSTVVGGDLGVKSVPTEVNVRYWAAGDGTTVDTASITTADAAARALGATLYFPPGTYLTQKLQPQNGSVWRLHRDAILKLDPSTPGTALIEIGLGGGNVLIEGGQLLGTWVKATSDGTTGGGNVAGQSLLKIEQTLATTISNVTVRKMTIRNAGSRGVFSGPIANRTLQDVLLEDISCVSCRSGFDLTGGGPLLADGRAQRFTLRRCTVDDTWHPPAGAKNSLYGGNAFTLGGIIDDLTIDGCRVVTCGRMALEIAPTALTSYGAMPARVTIRNSSFGPSAYRTFSICGDGITLTDNTVVELASDPSYVEIAGRNLVAKGNRFYNTGIMTVGTVASTQAQKDLWCKEWLITGNTFVDPGPDGAFYSLNQEGVTFADNTVMANTNLPAGLPVVRAYITVSHGHRMKVTGNQVHLGTPVLDRGLVTFSFNNASELSRNVFELDARVASSQTYGQGAGNYSVPLGLTANVGCIVEKNVLTVAVPLTISYGIIFPWVGDITKVTRRVYTSSSAYTDTVATDGPLNDPPVSPVTSGVYLVGDTPTGAWASNPLSFATWDGAAWTYQAVMDFFADRSGQPGGATYPGAPLTATTGDVYALVNNAPIGNIVADNQFDLGRKMTASMFPFALNSNTKGLSWHNVWQGNVHYPRTQSRVYINGDEILPRAGAPSLPPSAGTTLPPATIAHRGRVLQVRSAAGTADRHVVCAKDAANAYSWKDLV